MFFSRWPSLLLTVAMLVIVGICLKRIDFLLVDEVKAVISIAFGFATSCLLLSLIWILHRKPMHATWPAVANLTVVDTPNMHPRASMESVLANDRRMADRLAHHDPPPDYENALINSKPISWIVAANKDDELRKIRVQDQSLSEHQPPNFGQKQGNEDTLSRSEGTRGDRILALQSNETAPSNGPRKISSSPSPSSSDNNMTQLALSIVRGFTSVSNTSENLQQTGQDDAPTRLASSTNDCQRKISFCQLDANQLINQESPPKYCEITMSNIDQAQSDQSNEPRAGSWPDA